MLTHLIMSPEGYVRLECQEFEEEVKDGSDESGYQEINRSIGNKPGIGRFEVRQEQQVQKWM